ncbi:MAG: MFS transporter [Acidobacteriota bacterium]
MPKSRTFWIVAILPLTTIVSHTFGRSTYPLLLPVIRDDILGSNAEAGLGGTVIFLAYLTGVTLVTWMSVRFEPLRILQTGVALSVFGLTILSMAQSLPILLLGLAIASAAGAGIWLTAPVIITSGVAAEKRGFVIGLLSGSVGLAYAAVAGATRLAWDVTGDATLWRPVFAVEAAVALAILIAVVLQVRPVTGMAEESSKPPPRLESLQRIPTWLRLTAAYVCFGIVAAGFQSFLAAALEEDAGLARESVALVFMGSGLASVVGAPLTGWLSDRLGRRTAMGAVMTAMGVGSVCVATLNGPFLALVVVLFGGLWASYPTLTATYVRDHLDQRAFSSAFGVMTMAYGIAAVIPPLVVGLAADHFGTFRGVYLGLAAMAGIGAFLVWGLDERRLRETSTAGHNRS